MNRRIPPKLKPGDEIRVIAPSRSMGIIAPDLREVATRKLEDVGLSVTFARHAEEMDRMRSSSVASRLEDLHEAFFDPNVKGILTVIGGYNSNQLLKGLDYKRIQNHLKVLCGYSDITALQHAIFAQTGLVTYSGPHFSSFAMKKGFQYTLEYFRKCLLEQEPYTVEASPVWSDDAWFRDQEKRTFIANEGWVPISSGTTEGRILGGNLSTLVLLHGTEYMPSLDGALLLLEDDEEVHPQMFDRYLQSLLHQPGFEGVRGLVVGRFQQKSRMTQEALRFILKSKPELAKIPVVTNLDFGHTTPFFTFPVGGWARLTVEKDRTELMILEH